VIDAADPTRSRQRQTGIGQAARCGKDAEILASGNPVRDHEKVPKWEAGGRWTKPSTVPTLGYHSIHITHNTLYTYICDHVYCIDIH
jgi:hypothetical protein